MLPHRSRSSHMALGTLRCSVPSSCRSQRAKRNVKQEEELTVGQELGADRGRRSVTTHVAYKACRVATNLLGAWTATGWMRAHGVLVWVLRIGIADCGNSSEGATVRGRRWWLGVPADRSRRAGPLRRPFRSCAVPPVTSSRSSHARSAREDRRVASASSWARSLNRPGFTGDSVS